MLFVINPVTFLEKYPKKCISCANFNYLILVYIYNQLLFSLYLVVKTLPANTEYVRIAGSIPGSGRSPGEGNGNPLQCSCLENPMDRERSLAAYSPWGHRLGHDRSYLAHCLVILLILFEDSKTVKSRQWNKNKSEEWYCFVHYFSLMEENTPYFEKYSYPGRKLILPKNYIPLTMKTSNSLQVSNVLYIKLYLYRTLLRWICDCLFWMSGVYYEWQNKSVGKRWY